MSAFIDELKEALATRVVVADGAMGTMLQDRNPTMEDFEGLEGCNEILNVTRPDIVTAVHDAYFEVGVDAVETNTFGANFSNLADYDITERNYELNFAGAQLARAAADRWSTPGNPRWVFGSMGPGTKLPTLGHTSYAHLRDHYLTQAQALIEGGVSALLIETSQDLLQVKAAVVAAKRARQATGIEVPIIAQVTMETTGTMLLGSEIGAATTSLIALGVDLIGLNCATGPAEMSEHLRFLSQNSRVPISVMPNAGLPVLTSDGAYYPLSAAELAVAHSEFVERYGIAIAGGCCGTTPEHMGAVVEAVRGKRIEPRLVTTDATVSSLYVSVPLVQDSSYLVVGERTNANGSRAFRDAMLAVDDDACMDIAKSQIRDGAHVLDLCIDYVGRDGVADMERLAGLLATSSTLPVMLDSTEPKVLQAGLEKLGGRCIVNSVNFEDGDLPGSRFQQIMELVQEHGAAVVALVIDETGQARTAEHKLEIARRLIRQLNDDWGMATSDIMLDMLTFPIGTGQDETRRDGIETINAIKQIKAEFPDVKTVLGLSNVSFGLNPAARQVLNSVFLDDAIKAGLDAAIVHASKILPLAKISTEQREAASMLIWDQREYDGENLTFDPLSHFLNVFQDASESSTSNKLKLLDLPLFERIEARVIDGEKNGLDDDLAMALSEKPALSIVNENLLAAMKVVGERFASGEMQLPFVLQSAEVMKTAVALLEPHMEKADASGKGTIVLATVKGDVHDIGKNLVDIILTNNGFRVVNIGIKQPISAIIEAAEAEKADAIGMSGLLVKSTVIMKENLEEMNQRGLAKYPVILGGAALTRAFVEEDLAAMYQGEVRYARDAFEGLRLMDAIIDVKRGVEGAALPELRGRRIKADAPLSTEVDTRRSEITNDNVIPTPPFMGSKVIKGIAIAELVEYLDERSLFLGQWGLKPGRGENGLSYEELVETEGRPRLRYWLDRITSEKIINPALIYGFYPARSQDNSIFVQADDKELEFSFPRQGRDRRLCLADYVKTEGDHVAMHVVTMGARVSEVAAELFAANDYRNYVELHGLSVALTEALAEMWHARVRSEWGIGHNDADSVTAILKQQYQGERYSFGYPACPDLDHQLLLDELMDMKRIGVEVSEELQLHPEQSTSALIFHHPEASYFNAG